jgi:hypothetical protein
MKLKPSSYLMLIAPSAAGLSNPAAPLTVVLQFVPSGSLNR